MRSAPSASRDGAGPVPMWYQRAADGSWHAQRLGAMHRTSLRVLEVTVQLLTVLTSCWSFFRSVREAAGCRRAAARGLSTAAPAGKGAARPGKTLGCRSCCDDAAGAWGLSHAASQHGAKPGRLCNEPSCTPCSRARSRCQPWGARAGTRLWHPWGRKLHGGFAWCCALRDIPDLCSHPLLAMSARSA